MNHIKLYKNYINESYLEFKEEATQKVIEEFTKMYDEIIERYPEWGPFDPLIIDDIFVGTAKDMWGENNKEYYTNLVIGIPTKSLGLSGYSNNEFISIYPYFELDDWDVRFVFKPKSYRFFSLFTSFEKGSGTYDYDGIFKELDKIKEWCDKRMKSS
jgi:hypothetical protein